jgi:hypothetical protein
MSDQEVACLAAMCDHKTACHNSSKCVILTLPTTADAWHFPTFGDIVVSTMDA